MKNTDSDGQDDLRNTHLPSREEWTLIRQLYSETYPVKPILAYVLVQTERIHELEAENARLNMEMVAYRQKLTPKDVEAMTAVIKALTAEKAAKHA